MNKAAMLSLGITLLAGNGVQSLEAAVSLDRTRVVFHGKQKAVSLHIANDNQQLPYLAQSWIEDENGNKITSPLMALPPVQRLEPGMSSLVKIQATPESKQLPQDRESLFYLSVREIPPRSEQPNVLQIALQTRIKLFYRPEGLEAKRAELIAEWLGKLTLQNQNGDWVINNPTPYYVTLVELIPHSGAAADTRFKAMMVAPREKKSLNVSQLGASPSLTYINDYGGRPKLTFQCGGEHCQVINNKVE